MVLIPSSWRLCRFFCKSGEKRLRLRSGRRQQPRHQNGLLEVLKHFVDDLSGFVVVDAGALKDLLISLMVSHCNTRSGY